MKKKKIIMNKIKQKKLLYTSIIHHSAFISLEKPANTKKTKKRAKEYKLARMVRKPRETKAMFGNQQSHTS